MLIARLESLAAEDSSQVIMQTIENSGGLSIEQISKITSLPEDTILSVALNLIESGKTVGFPHGSSQIILADSTWENIKSQCENYLTVHHSQYYLRRGLPREELRSKLNINNELFQGIIAKLEAENLLVQDGTDIRMKTHSPTLSSEDQRLSTNYLDRLNENPNTPPTDIFLDTEILNYLSNNKQVVIVGSGIVYSRIAYDEQINEVLNYMKTRGTISVGEARDLLGASRKYILPFLESMDELRLTRRSGDDRVLE
jgi:selenocysteine-specific elongation factor